MSSNQLAPWQALEERIKDFFAQSGYEAHRSVIREGRSGGRHEVDVFATKSDGITDFAVMVECKAWNHPIEKDVVSKVSFVMQDLGLNKGIIVSLEGWRSGADHAARELGIDLWDAVDLEKRLGPAMVAQLRRPGAPQRHVVGPVPRLDDTNAERQLSKERSGLLRREAIAWSRLAWVPFYLLELRLSHTDKRFLRKSQVKSRVVRNLYNAVSGGFHLVHDASVPLVEVGADSLIPARVRSRTIEASIKKECGRLGELVNASAIQRQSARVDALGIPRPFDRVDVDSVHEIAWPYYVALVRRGDDERLVAVDAVRARTSELVSRALTEHCRFVVDALESTSRVG